jgi:hypothetical protein
VTAGLNLSRLWSFLLLLWIFAQKKNRKNLDSCGRKACGSYPSYLSVRRLTNRKKRLLSSLLLLLAADAAIAGPLRGWLQGFFRLVGRAGI